MLINCDLHIHGRFSIGTSRSLTFESLAFSAKRKGLHLLGTGDILHPEWRRSFTSRAKEVSPGIYEINNVNFVCTAEVEDEERVHHLLIFPDIESAEELSSSLDASALKRDGRPKLHLSAEKIASYCEKYGILIGPSHAFTPYTAMYAAHSSVKSCYQGMSEYISFIELGLSADSSYADRIEELSPLVFLSNSDSHSADRIAREFNIIEMDSLDFPSLERSLSRYSGAVTVNAGFYPQEGKYNETACARCYRHYKIEDAVRYEWRCTCSGRIKKGVVDRVNELATYDMPRHPPHRGRYIHLVPLETLVSLGSGEHSRKKVARIIDLLVAAFGSEIKTLLSATPEEIGRVAGSGVGRVFRLYREEKLEIIPGGGGEYGRIKLPADKNI